MNYTLIDEVYCKIEDSNVIDIMYVWFAKHNVRQYWYDSILCDINEYFIILPVCKHNGKTSIKKILYRLTDILDTSYYYIKFYNGFLKREVCEPFSLETIEKILFISFVSENDNEFSIYYKDDILKIIDNVNIII